jgi:NitT/TauT family transport system ATP-binding protein
MPHLPADAATTAPALPRAPTAAAAAVAFLDVRKTFPIPGGGRYTALGGVTLAVAPGEFVAIVGPTGGGKSTLLNLAAGLLAPDAGEVRVFDVPLRGLNRSATYLFQQDVLLPWKTAEENVMLGLLFRRRPAAQCRALAREWLARVGLGGFENRYPHQLSGGMRKRVALAQTLIVDPEILLMDEPFGSLDVQTRQIMENDLLRIWAEFRKTVLFVTHDLEEAIALSDRVVVLSSGPSARVIGSYPVPLPRPRDVAAIRLEEAFVEIYRTIWHQLHAEVRRAYARETGEGAG